MAGYWRIYVTDPSPLFRQGIRMMLDTLDRPVQVLETPGCDALCAGEYPPGSKVDLAILSAGLFGTDHLRQLREGVFRQTRILLMTESQAASIPARAPVDGLIDKSQGPEAFRQAIETLMEGGTWFPERSAESPPSQPRQGLSGKQQRVLALIGEGRSNKQIAARLHLSESTVKHHITRIYRLLDLDNPTRTRLAQHALPPVQAARASAER